MSGPLHWADLQLTTTGPRDIRTGIQRPKHAKSLVKFCPIAWQISRPISASCDGQASSPFGRAGPCFDSNARSVPAARPVLSEHPPPALDTFATDQRQCCALIRRARRKHRRKWQRQRRDNTETITARQRPAGQRSRPVGFAPRRAPRLIAPCSRPDPAPAPIQSLADKQLILLDHHRQCPGSRQFARAEIPARALNRISISCDQ